MANFVIHLSISLTYGIFSDYMKVPKIAPAFKGGDSTDLGYYRPISVLPCFSKILEPIMYNWLYKHLSNLKIIYPRQLGFQKGHATDHALLQLVDQIYESLEPNKYTIGVFIDLSLTFHTFGYNIPLKKLEVYTTKLWNAMFLTGIHFRTSPFASLYQQSSVQFRSTWPYYVCWRHKFVLFKQGYKYCFAQSKRCITKYQWMVYF